MIAQTQKPTEEILEYLEGKEKIVLIGCGGCATVFHTGGEPEVKEMAKKLTEEGKKVLAAIAPPFTISLLQARMKRLRSVPGQLGLVLHIPSVSAACKPSTNGENGLNRSL